MEVDFAFLADAAEVSNGKLYSIGGAFDTIYAKEVPVVHPAMSFALRLLLSPAELDRTHQLEVVLIDGDGKRLGGIGGEVNVSKKTGSPVGWRTGFLTAVPLYNLHFESFGDYAFEIVVNGTSMKSIPLRVASR